MAKVWFVKDGPEPTRGTARAVVSVEFARTRLRLAEFLKEPPAEGDSQAGPRFGSAFGPVPPYGAPRHVVVELDPAEATAAGLRPGFYRADIAISEANQILPE